MDIFLLQARINCQSKHLGTFNFTYVEMCAVYMRQRIDRRDMTSDQWNVNISSEW